MKKYDYKFVEVESKNGLKTKKGDCFDACKEVILSEAKQGWRLKQVLVPFNEKEHIYSTWCYQIIFEKEID